MKLLPNACLFFKADEVPTTATLPFPEEASDDSKLMWTLGWISAGLGAVALGLFVGRELRERYKFNHRTPYDAYSHAGDERDVDFGLGT